MITGSIARRYAKALFSLAALGAALAGSPELRDALASPASREQRRALAEGLARPLALEREPANLLLLLAERNRLGQLAAVADAFRALADEKLGRVRARLVSAVPLGGAAASGIAEKLAAAAKAEVLVERAVDPVLLGGVVAQVGSVVYDGSVRTQLEALRRALKQ